MLAAVIERPGAVTVRQVPVPQAGGLALVRVGVAGICGTDRKLAAGVFPVTAPRVLGHEMTGWVEVPGPGGAVPAGTPVVVNPAVFCGLCRECRRDLPHLCARGGLLGRDLDGCFAEYVAVPEALLHPLPAEVTADQAALVQVLSTCVHALSGVAVSPEASAVVVGLGVAGLLHVQLLRARGVRAIVGVTRAAWKRDLALGCGASSVVAPDDAAAAVAEATAGRGADVAIECLPAPAATLAQAIRLAGPGAAVILFGAVLAGRRAAGLRGVSQRNSRSAARAPPGPGTSTPRSGSARRGASTPRRSSRAGSRCLRWPGPWPPARTRRSSRSSSTWPADDGPDLQRCEPRGQADAAARRPQAPAARGAFVVEGIQPVWQAVEAGADVEVLVVAPDLLGGSAAARMVAAQEAAGVRVARLTGELFARVSARDGPSGLAAIVRGGFRGWPASR